MPAALPRCFWGTATTLCRSLRQPLAPRVPCAVPHLQLGTSGPLQGSENPPLIFLRRIGLCRVPYGRSWSRMGYRLTSAGTSTLCLGAACTSSFPTQLEVCLSLSDRSVTRYSVGVTQDGDAVHCIPWPFKARLRQCQCL